MYYIHTIICMCMDLAPFTRHGKHLAGLGAWAFPAVCRHVLPNFYI